MSGSAIEWSPPSTIGIAPAATTSPTVRSIASWLRTGAAGRPRPSLQRVEPRRRARRHRRRPRHVTQQGDLAEAVAATQRGKVATVVRHLQLAVGDRVEAVAWLALADDALAGRHLDGLELARKRLELRRAARGAKRQPTPQR